MDHPIDHDASVAVVAGVGPGIGAALARAFAGAGHAVALLARSADKLSRLEAEIPGARGFGCDVADAASVERAFARIRAEMGEPSVLLYNAGSGVFAGVEEITPEQFEEAWRVNALGALLCSRQVLPAMKARRRGTIVFIGATASLRGAKRTAAFAPAKAAQRSLAQSLARSLWPEGIHVALIIVDGAVDMPTSRAMMKDKPAEAFVSPDGVASIALGLHRQDRRAWSFEVEARPAVETW